MQRLLVQILFVFFISKCTYCKRNILLLYQTQHKNLESRCLLLLLICDVTKSWGIATYTHASCMRDAHLYGKVRMQKCSDAPILNIFKAGIKLVSSSHTKNIYSITPPKIHGFDTDNSFSSLVIGLCVHNDYFNSYLIYYSTYYLFQKQRIIFIFNWPIPTSQHFKFFFVLGHFSFDNNVISINFEDLCTYQYLVLYSIFCIGIR